MHERMCQAKIIIEINNNDYNYIAIQIPEIAYHGKYFSDENITISILLHILNVYVNVYVYVHVCTIQYT